MQDFQRQKRDGRRRWPNITPFAYQQTVYLPISIEAARGQLIARLSGIFTVDGGTRYRRAWPYRDLQQYTGLVHGDWFNLAGPFGLGTMPTIIGTPALPNKTIPMIIEGELHPDGQTSLVHLSVRTELGPIWRSLVGLFLVGAVAALLRFWLILPGLLIIVLYYYVDAVLMVHRQVRLLIAQRFLAQ